MLLSLVMVVSLFTMIPFEISAVSSVNYMDENGDLQTAANVTELTSSSTALETGWYAVTSDITISSRIECNGDVHIILCDYATLKAPKGITVCENSDLTIYGQSPVSSDVSRGKLLIDDVDQYFAGIGGMFYSYTVTINGGIIEATGAQGAAGIGGCYTSDGYVTINGGTVIATGGELAAGIGGYNTDEERTTVNLSWKSVDDSIHALDYNGTVTLEKKFIKETISGVQTILPAGVVADKSVIDNMTLLPLKHTGYIDADGTEKNRVL